MKLVGTELKLYVMLDLQSVEKLTRDSHSCASSPLRPIATPALVLVFYIVLVVDFRRSRGENRDAEEKWNAFSRVEVMNVVAI